MRLVASAAAILVAVTIFGVSITSVIAASQVSISSREQSANKTPSVKNKESTRVSVTSKKVSEAKNH